MAADDLLVDALAAARLVRLVRADSITRHLRGEVIEAAYRRRPSIGLADVPPEERVVLDDDPPPVAKLVTCAWCLGVWAAVGVVVARRVAPRWWPPVARALAMSHVVGMLAEVESHG